MSARRVVQRHSSIISGWPHSLLSLPLYLEFSMARRLVAFCLAVFSSSAALCQKASCLVLRYR
jgi:hypothetical protein